MYIGGIWFTRVLKTRESGTRALDVEKLREHVKGQLKNELDHGHGCREQ